MIQSVQRALAILERLGSETGKSMPLGELARAVGLHPATCANLVKTLVHAQWIEQREENREYTLGPMVFHLAKQGPHRKDIASFAAPVVMELAKQIGETVAITAIHVGKRYILLTADGTQSLQVKRDVIVASDVYNAASTWVLLAFMPQQDLETFLRINGMPEAAVYGVESASGLRAKLDAIRSDGFCILDTDTDVAKIAFPLFEGSATAVAAIGVYMPAFRFNGANKRQITLALGSAAEEIGQLLSSSPAKRREKSQISQKG